MKDTTVLKGNKEGGLLDMLINKGTLPEVKISMTNETFIAIGLTIVISAIIVILINAIVKHFN